MDTLGPGPWAVVEISYVEDHIPLTDENFLDSVQNALTDEGRELMDSLRPGWQRRCADWLRRNLEATRCYPNPGGDEVWVLEAAVERSMDEIADWYDRVLVVEQIVTSLDGLPPDVKAEIPKIRARKWLDWEPLTLDQAEAGAIATLLWEHRHVGKLSEEAFQAALREVEGPFNLP